LGLDHKGFNWNLRVVLKELSQYNRTGGRMAFIPIFFQISSKCLRAASFEASCQWLVATVTSRTPLFTFTVGLCQHTFLFGRCITDSFEISEAQVREPLPKVGWLIGALNPVLHQG